EHSELGTVDYHKLAGAGNPMDWFAALVDEELGKSRDAVLVVGPPVLTHEKESQQSSERRAQAAPLFYLQYALNSRSIHVPSMDPIENAGPRLPHRVTDAAPMAQMSVATADGIQKLVARFKGETIAIRTPHDLAEAIHRIDPRIPRSAAPPQAAEPP